MTEDNVVSIINEQFRRLNARMDKSDLEFLDLKMRVSAIEDHVAALVTGHAGLNHRMDRVEERLTRIERRLDLVEPR
jgi:predicted  nucleic acid-binding Zn-ribbon protein